MVRRNGRYDVCLYPDEMGKVGKEQVSNLAVGNGREEEDCRRERAEEGLSSC
jgi:hypothetical protein